MSLEEVEVLGRQLNAEAGGGEKWGRSRCIAGFVLVLLVFVIVGGVIYSNTLEGPFIFDDYQNIRDNPHIRLTELNLRDIIRAGFKSYNLRRSIVFMSFALNYYFHQDDVWGYHFTNIAIHILTGIFVYLFVKNTLRVPLLRSRYEHLGPIAFFAAVLWLVHPIQSQAVSYIVQRLASLAGMFYILSLLLYVKGRLARLRGQRSWFWFAGCVAAGVAAFGCKEMTAVLPAFILLYEWYFFQDLSIRWLKQKVPYVIGIFVILVFLGLFYLGTSPFEKVLSAYGRRDFTLGERLLTESRVVICYIGLLFAPLPGRLNLDHDITISHSLIDPVTTLFCILVILCLVGLAVYSAKKERLLSFCILWYFGNLLIESSVIGLELMFEHRLYIPSMLVCVGVVTVVWRCIKKDWVKVTAFCIAAMLLGAWTYERNKVYGDLVGLWQDCVDKSPRKARPRNNLGNALKDAGRIDEAIMHFNKSLELGSDSAEVHSNLGNALSKQGKIDEAIEHYRKALSLGPKFAEAHYNLAVALAEQGNVDEAIFEYREALKFGPKNIDALNNLGYLLAGQGNGDEAVGYYKKAIVFEPDNVIAHGRLGLALTNLGRVDEAIEEFRFVLKLSPEDIEMYCNLGLLLERQGKFAEAIEQYHKALEINPNYARAHGLLNAASDKQKSR